MCKALSIANISYNKLSRSPRREVNVPKKPKTRLSDQNRSESALNSAVMLTNKQPKQTERPFSVIVQTSRNARSKSCDWYLAQCPTQNKRALSFPS